MLVECRTCTHSDDVRLTGRAQMSPAYIMPAFAWQEVLRTLPAELVAEAQLCCFRSFWRFSAGFSASSVGHSVQRRRTFAFLSDHTPLRQLLRDRAASLVGPGFTICWVTKPGTLRRA